MRYVVKCTVKERLLRRNKTEQKVVEKMKVKNACMRKNLKEYFLVTLLDKSKFSLNAMCFTF
ncbi:hypothetical protein DRO69_03585 [Candidatus Bathyarchaeota archaeon]|nr:MAG: hypothetical protein DRO69_03585 [Candidatus Bathyarchaeota archaeon]